MKLEKKSYTVLSQEKNWEKNCIMYLWGTVDRCIGQHLGRLSIDISAGMSADTRSTLNRYAGDTQSLQSVSQ